MVLSNTAKTKQMNAEWSSDRIACYAHCSNQLKTGGKKNDESAVARLM